MKTARKLTCYLLPATCYLFVFGLLVMAMISGGATLADASIAGAAAPTPVPQAQDPTRPWVVRASRQDLSPELRTLQPLPPASQEAAAPSPYMALPHTGGAAAAPLGPVLQDWHAALAMPTPELSFEGINNVDGLMPPDTQGDVGPSHYVQWVNVSFAIWDKDGNKLYGPADGNTLWQGFGGACESQNNGDPITLYDPWADRWFMSQFSLPYYPYAPFYQCIAVSQTGDPTGAWYRYEFETPSGHMNDYPKFGVWPDGYYMSINQFASGSGDWRGVAVAAFERDAMLRGDAGAHMVFFDVGAVDDLHQGILPADFDGLTPPPDGAPNYFVGWTDSTWRDEPDDALRVWEFHVDWDIPGNATFGQDNTTFEANARLVTADVNPNLCNGYECIPQPGTGQLLDPLSGVLMYRSQYRNFGDYEVLVSNRSVDVDGSDHAGIYWFELRRSDGVWDLHQEGVYAPDSAHRWMGSVAMDHVGNIALGYSVSSKAVYPSIRYAGRLAGDPLGELPQGETTLIDGSGSQLSSFRWGDYSMMAVDPVDDCTFWYTQEYYVTSGSNWQTRIGAFKFPECYAEQRGTLTGKVYDTGSAQGIAGAQVEARTTGADSASAHKTTASGDGTYEILLPVGSYTVTAAAYGYQPAGVTDVEISANTVTTQDLPLSPATMYVISGTVTDAEAGWPLYAEIDVEGLPIDAVWSQPETGVYSLTLAEGLTYTLCVATWSEGYETISAPVGPLTGDTVRDFALTADMNACLAPGYTSQGLTCQLMAGGLVVGNVYDANTGAPLIGAAVTDGSGRTAMTAATLDDPRVPEGFYAHFLPVGTHTVTATKEAYGPEVLTVTTAQSATLWQDFWLPAGQFVYTPTAYSLTLRLGMTETLPLTLSNLGQWPADFGIQVVGGIYGLEEPGGLITVPQSHRARGVTGTLASQQAPFRYPAGGIYYDPVPLFSWAGVHTSSTSVLLLFADESADPLYTILGAYPDIGVLDMWDAQAQTPALADLLPYDVVIAWSNYAFADAKGVGDTLADYVDAGGKLILAPFATSTAPWALAGRLAREGYLPLVALGQDKLAAEASLGAYDVAHPIMQSVTAAEDIFRDAVALSAGAHLVAAWDDGIPFVATKARELALPSQGGAEGARKGTVVAINTYPGHYYQWSGDVGILFHNAINYLRAVGEMSWLRTTPLTGTVAALSTQPVTVTFDAGVPEVDRPGLYQARLSWGSDTPYILESVPVTLTVLDSPAYAKLAGVVTGLGHCDAAPSALADAELRVAAASGVTWTLATGDGGAYDLWLHPALAPLTVTVTHPEHAPAVAAGVLVTAQMTTTLDFGLRLLAPCPSADPPSVTVTLQPGTVVTRSLALVNSGLRPYTFNLVEADVLGIPAEAAWLLETPSSGIVPEDASLPLALRFEAPLEVGAYKMRLVVQTDDLDRPEFLVPVTMQVTPGPQVSVSPAALAATVRPDDTVTRTLTISNAGEGALIWTLGYTPTVAWLKLPGGTVRLPGMTAPLTRSTVGVTLDASATVLVPGDYQTTLVLAHNDADQPVMTVPVTLHVRPSGFNVFLPLVLRDLTP